MRKILSYARRAIEQYEMIENNDTIAVGVSGGKDSIVLLKALCMLKVFYPKKFELKAITIDLFNGQTDYQKLNAFCKENNVELHVVNSNIFEVVFEDRKEKNPCSLCAKMRRGILNTKAIELGCNKVALGHHAEDLVETFFLSLFYEGRISAFHPVTYLSNTNLMVIRPLMITPENLIVKASKDMPIVKNCCPADKKTKREYMKNLIKNIEKDIPDVTNRILDAITQTERYNLFDKILSNYNKLNSNDNCKNNKE